MKLTLTEDGTLIGPAGATYGRMISMEIELIDRPRELTPTQVRDLASCTFCEAEVGELCRRWRGGDRKTNHAERVKDALELVASRATLSERSERYGNSAVSSSSTVNVKGKEPSYGGQEARPTATALEREAITRIWAYYLELVPSRRQLDDKRKRIIRGALATVRAANSCDLPAAERLVKLAVLGLSRSPHHNGQNDQRRKYLEIRYALKGIGNESDDERIEKAISWAAIYAPNGSEHVDEAKVQRWLDDVRYTLSLSHRPEADRARESYEKLIAAGFKVMRQNSAPWARLTR